MKKLLTLAIIVTLVGFIFPTLVSAQDDPNASLDTSLTIHNLKDMSEFRGREIAEMLGLDPDVDKDTPVGELGVSREMLIEVFGEEELEEHHDDPEYATLKYILYVVIVILSLWFLLKGGIPKAADSIRRKKWYPQGLYLAVMAFSVLILGFFTGKSPNPMEAVVKVFKAFGGMYPTTLNYIGFAVFFLFLAWIVNKAVCGWACPFGSLEELLYTLPFFKKAKKWQLPFWISNTFRFGLFIAALLYLFGVIGEGKYVIYHGINPFNLFTFDFKMFSFDFETKSVFWFIAGYLLVSFFFYRPFCRLICPFGLVSWIVELFSLTKIKIDRTSCTDCRACANACPMTSAKNRLDKSPLPADCFACMRCLRVCPEDAIHWKPFWWKPTQGS